MRASTWSTLTRRSIESVLQRTVQGRERPARPTAQITAFEDTWHWNADTEATEARDDGGPQVASMIGALRSFIGANQMMAYLVMMAVRLVELHRVLKPTGSLYLHCDPTASHYLKIVLDAIFGPERFGNEIVWKRTTTHSDANGGPWLTIAFCSTPKGQRYSLQRPYRLLDGLCLDKYYNLMNDGQAISRSTT